MSKDPAKSFIKKYLNPSQKFYASKECSKSFTDLSNPNYWGSKGKQVYESYSASRSGGTGEQNYTDQMKNQINKSFIAPNDSTGPSCIMKNTVWRPSQNIHSNRISTLTKENVKLKSDYEKLKTQMVLMEKFLEEAKLKSSEDSVKLKHYETIIQQKDLNIKKMKEQFQEERETENKIIAEYVNAENYLLELVDEFTHGMRKIYANDIEFKDVDIDGLPFWERFSNLLYNILLIIDFQKQFIVEQSKVSNQMNQNMYDNQSVIEEAENEEETDHEVNTQKHQNDENESGDEVLMRSHEHEAFQNSNLSIDYRRQSQNSKSKNYHNEEIYSYNVKKENSKNYSSELFSDEDVRNSIDHALFMKNEPLQEYIYYKDTSNLPLANTTKFLWSPSEMKINESPKISLLIQRSNKSNSYKQQDSLENLKNTDMRQSNNQNIHTFNPFAYSLQNNFMEKQILTSKDLISKAFWVQKICAMLKFINRKLKFNIAFPNSESSQSIKKTISENRYKNSDNNMSEESSENRMSLESIIIKRSEDKYKNSNNESTEEIFTPNFITIRSSIGNLKNLESDQSDNILSLKKNIEDKFDIWLPLTSGFDSIENKVIEDYNYDYSDSIDWSEQMFSSNREDVEELKTEFVFPKAITKTN